MNTRSQHPLTCLITKGDATSANYKSKKAELIEIVRAAVASSVSIVQIREKQISSKELYELSKAAAAVVTGSDTLLLVNDRADIALAAGADGVHLRSDSIRASIVRSTFPADFMIGVSAHSLDEIIQARGDGADFALFGPVFATPGKQAVGLSELNYVCETAAPFPVLGLGGIGETNAAAVLSAGASGIAAIRFFNGADGLAFARDLRNLNES